jgi:hypothetical protein
MYYPLRELDFSADFLKLNLVTGDHSYNYFAAGYGER